MALSRILEVPQAHISTNISLTFHCKFTLGNCQVTQQKLELSVLRISTVDSSTSHCEEIQSAYSACSLFWCYCVSSCQVTILNVIAL